MSKVTEVNVKPYWAITKQVTNREGNDGQQQYFLSFQTCISLPNMCRMTKKNNNRRHQTYRCKAMKKKNSEHRSISSFGINQNLIKYQIQIQYHHHHFLLRIGPLTCSKLICPSCLPFGVHLGDLEFGIILTCCNHLKDFPNQLMTLQI